MLYCHLVPGSKLSGFLAQRSRMVLGVVGLVHSGMMRYGENSGSLPLKIAKNGDRNGSQALTHLMDRIASIREKAAALNPGCRDAVDMRIGTI